MNPTKEFRDYMISQGAALVGIGDLTTVPSSDRCPADLRCSGYPLSVRCLSYLRPVLPGTCTEKYIVAFGYATRRYRICFCML